MTISHNRCVPLALSAALMLTAMPAAQAQVVMKFATLTLNDVQHEYIKVFKAEI